MRRQAFVCLRFYGRLNDFLPKQRRRRWLDQEIQGRPAVVDPLQAVGVPHTEIGRVTINGRKVSLSCQVEAGDKIKVWPRQSLCRGRGPRFVLDVHLGKLAKYLRLLGFDTLYRNDASDKEVIDTAVHQRRTVLTRDVGLLKHRRLGHGYWVRHTAPHQQFREVLQQFGLWKCAKPFERCLACNGRLVKVRKEVIVECLLPGTRRRYRKFYRCRQCGKIYWAGSHYKQMCRLIAVCRR